MVQMKVGAGLTLVALQTMLFVVPSVSVSVALKSLSSSSAKKRDMSSGSENKIQIFSEKSSHTCCHPNLCISKNPFPVPLWFCFHSPLSAERNQNSVDSTQETGVCFRFEIPIILMGPLNQEKDILLVWRIVCCSSPVFISCQFTVRA